MAGIFQEGGFLGSLGLVGSKPDGYYNNSPSNGFGLGPNNPGQQASQPQVQGVSSGPIEGTMYYDSASGQVMRFTNGQWVAGNGPTTAANTGVNGGLSVQSYDPGTLALYDNQIGTANSALGRIGNQRNIGYGNIDKTYGEAVGQLAGDRSAAEGAYNLQKDRTGQD